LGTIFFAKFHGVVLFPDGQREEGDWESGPNGKYADLDGNFHGVKVRPDGTRSRLEGPLSF